MGGKLMGGRRVTAEEGWKVAGKVMNELEPVVAWQMVCGSLRRGKAEVGDVDVVVHPATGKGEELGQVLVRMFGKQKDGRPARTGLVDGVQVDVYVSEPGAFGAMIVFVTGSAEDLEELLWKELGGRDSIVERVQRGIEAVERAKVEEKK